MMHVAPIARLVFAALPVFAMIYQLVSRLDTPGFRISNFFSFFTIQSNILAALVLLAAAVVPPAARSGRFDLIRGAATLYISITGVVYGLLLSGYQEALQTTIPWVDTVLHKLIPLVLVVDWLLDPPRVRLTVRKALIWLIYPIAYFAYTMIRGPIVDWYPYPFLNPDQRGVYVAVALYAAGIAAGALLFAALLTETNRRVRLAWSTPAPPAA